MDFLIVDIDGVLQKSTYAVNPHKQWSMEDERKYKEGLKDNEPAIALLAMIKDPWKFLITGRKLAKYGDITQALADKIGVRSTEIFYYPHDHEFDLDIYLNHKLKSVIKIVERFKYLRPPHKITIIEDDADVCDFLNRHAFDIKRTLNADLNIIQTAPFF